jgi:Zn-dependent peptidase ImmA (M78 family)
VSRVEVATGVLRWALDRAGRSESELAKKKKFSKIREWLSGEIQPTLRQLEEFAKATCTPLGYLFLKKPPEERLPIPHFRTLDDEDVRRPSPDLLETVQLMQQRQSWMRDYLIDEGHERLPFVASAKSGDPPAEVAGMIRDILNLGEGWAARHQTWTKALGHLRHVVEERGILIAVNGVVGNNVHRKLDPGEFRGFVLVDEYAPLVFVNGADAKAAQMFTLAHELAHVVFGSSAAFDLREMQPADNPTEKACNRIAAEFLVPGHEINSAWETAKGEQEPFQMLARQFKVSPIVAARRALDLRLIDKNEFFEFYFNYLKDERRKAAGKKSGGDFYETQNLRIGQRFASAVLQAAKEGKLLYSEAYRLTGLYGSTFDSYTASLENGERQ